MKPQVVGRAGVGVDNVDLKAATEYGCIVVNAPTANTVAAAEHGIALLCALSRNVAQANMTMKAGGWDRSKYVGVSLVDKTLAIMGFGKVGSEVALRARGLGMKVIAHDPYAPEERAKAVGARLVGMDEALETADFFSLHMPLTPSTERMFNKAAFQKMKPSARIINVARGGVIDDEALAWALEEGEIAAAALDVFNEEPPPASNPLIGRDDVILTPHLGASTVEAQEGVAIEVAEAVMTSLKGEICSSSINAPMVPNEVLEELKPYTVLVERLAAFAAGLVEDGVNEVRVAYGTSRPDSLDSRLLRAMAIKGVLESFTTSNINLVNADYTAEQRGMKVVEIKETSSAKGILSKVTISIPSQSKFQGATVGGKIAIQGAVKDGVPFVTKIGEFDVDVALTGPVVLCTQKDQPGMIGAVGNILGGTDVNINHMTVGRTGPQETAVMCIGVDSAVGAEALQAIKSVPAIIEAVELDL